VAADILGVSGRAMLTALVAGERDPKVLAELAKGADFHAGCSAQLSAVMIRRAAGPAMA
jgi:hypothetical protein